MMKTTFRILIALLVAAAIWWVGPLISIGVYRPLGWLIVREILVAGFLLWGFWPLLVRLWSSLVLGTKQIKPAPAVKTSNFITERIKELERQLQTRWLKLPRRSLLRLKGQLLREYRQFMPFFMVLGAQGSGKSSLIAQAVKQSSLQADRLSQRRIDSGSASEFEFWLASDAVWVDTNGQWISESYNENPKSVWQQLLHGLKRLGRETVINALVVTVDLANLLALSLEDRKRFAGALRNNIVTVREVYAKQPQVYIALTGLDKLDGAMSVLKLMSVEQWGSGIGFALPYGSHKDDGLLLESRWQTALIELEHRVQQQVLFASPTVGSVADNHQQLQFVEALSQLRKPLLDLLLEIVAPLEDEKSCDLRGVWFGSVLEIEDVQGIQASGLLSLGTLWQPLVRQLISEKSATLSKTGQSWRSRFASVMRWSLVGLVATIGLGWLSWGYLAERDQLERVLAQFTEGKRLAQYQVGDKSSETQLLQISAQMRYALAQADNANDAATTPYLEHVRLASVASETYHRHLQKTLMPEFYNQVHKTLTDQSNGSAGDVYLTLKVYLMMSRKDRRNIADVEHWINERWDSIAGGQYNEDDHQALLIHVRNLFAMSDLPATPEDTTLVKQARARAAQIPTITRVLKHIIDQGLPSQITDISLARAAGYGSSVSLRLRSNLVATDASISGWYTRAGYNDVFLPRIENSTRAVLEEESWVLRDEPLSSNVFEVDKTVEKLADAVRNQFLQDYVRFWQTFLKDITIRQVTGLDDAAQLAGTMIDIQSPLAQLIRVAGRETTLTGNYDGDVDSWVDRQKHNIEKNKRAIVGEISGEHTRNKLLPEFVVEDHFDGLRRLATQLTKTGNGENNPLSRLFEPLSTQLAIVNGSMQAGQITPQQDAFSRLRNEAARQPEPVRGIMLDLISNGSSMTAKQSTTLINRDAAGAAHAVCAPMTGLYPMQRGAKSEAGVQDFERLFGPQGVMATHFRDQLASYVDTYTTPWTVKRVEGGAQINPEVLRSYEIADKIRSNLLDQSGHMKISAVLRFIEMDPQLAESQLDIAGQHLHYAHGSTAPVRVDWTGQSANLSIRLYLRSVDGRTETLHFDGPWALFKFFDAGQQNGGSAERRVTVYQAGIGSVKIEWQAVTLPSPLWSELLHSFRCQS